MYLKFYGLKKEPFHITPDPSFLFLSPSHREALASIVYGIENKKGFIAIVGAVGVGKTTILRSYLEKIDRGRLKTIYVFNANVSFGSLLKTIYQELGVVADTDDSFLLVNRLQQVLIEEYEKGHNVVLIVDEAQNMPVETIENLRMLSNLETNTEKLIQIVMIGQTEFDNLLAHHELRQLRQRIAIRTVISPLSPDDSINYIKHRLSKVTENQEGVFTDDAMHEIIRAAKGIPRIINILCDNALITGYGYQKKPVTARIVREILKDFQEPAGRPAFPWRYASAAMLLILAAAFFWISPYRGSILGLFGAEGSKTGVAGAGVAVSVPADPRTTRMAGKTAAGEDGEKGASATLSRSLPATSTPAPQPVPAAFDKIGRDRRIEDGEKPAKDTTASGTLPATAKADTRAPARQEGAETPGSRSRTVEKGDTLSQLIRQRYGEYDADILRSVKQKNPGIRDPDRIRVGDQILFPDQGKPSENRTLSMGKKR